MAPRSPDPLRDGSPHFPDAAAGFIFRHCVPFPFAPARRTRELEAAFAEVRGRWPTGICRIFPEGHSLAMVNCSAFAWYHRILRANRTGGADGLIRPVGYFFRESTASVANAVPARPVLGDCLRVGRRCRPRRHAEALFARVLALRGDCR
jgi:hypothetical protein